jgi:hypothetical protein
MAATPQSQAIGIANQLITAADTLIQLDYVISQINQQWTDVGTANILNAMGTVAQNVDGSMGATDGTANVAHPLNPATYGSLLRAVSANQLASMLTVLNNIPLYINGSAISATPGVRAILNAEAGG